MKKKILFLIIMCVVTTQSYAMQRFVRVTKRCMATVGRKVNYTQKINLLAKRVARKGEFSGCYKASKSNASKQFTYDILKTLHREQDKNTCMLQLEESIETIFYHISQLKSDTESLEFKMGEKKISSFSKRLKEEKKE